MEERCSDCESVERKRKRFNENGETASAQPTEPIIAEHHHRNIATDVDNHSSSGELGAAVGDGCGLRSQINETERTSPDGDSTGKNSEFKFSSDLSLESIRKMQARFVDERNWSQFHTPRNLLLAMIGEVGELSELFQWKNEVPVGLTDWSESERTHLSEELSDVLIYLIRLAEQCHVDLPSAVLRKIDLNHRKYPADRVFGSSKKYSEYSDESTKAKVNGSSLKEPEDN